MLLRNASSKCSLLFLCSRTSARKASPGLCSRLPTTTTSPAAATAAAVIVRRFSENAKANPTNAEADDQQQRLPAHYRDPSFYKYFPTFLAENSLRKHLPPELWFQYSRALEELEELQEIVQQTSNLGGGDSTAQQSDDDKAFSELAQAELETSTSRLAQLQEQMLTAVVTDDREVTECTLEVRAGVGGKEACLFADELHRLYLKFIAYSGWEVRGAGEGFNEDLEASETTISNIDDSSSSLWSASVEVVGAGCYRALRHEAGVHRVQRVPKTERYGRIHTSTVSLSVLPVRANLVVIREADLKFDVKNSSGAGGQNVNRNLTCVRVTHLPTGLAVEAQETRYQYLNKDIALRKLTALLNSLEFERQAKEARAERRLQIGLTAARSDKIRTYNWPQNRITDHRLTGGDGGGGGGGNFHNISGYMAGEECERMKATIERLEEGRHTELVRQVRLALEQSFLSRTTTTTAAAKKRKK